MAAGALALAAPPSSAQTNPPPEPSEPAPGGPKAPAQEPSAPQPPPGEAPRPFGFNPTVVPTNDIKVSPLASIRFGLQAQVWLDSNQSPVKQPDGSDGKYENNIFLRRLRILGGVSPIPNVAIVVLAEGSNLGKATGPQTNGKNLSTISFLDGYAEVKFADAFYLEAGLQLVPLTRNILQGTTTYLTLDVGNTSAVMLAPLQTAALRDLGLGFKGVVLDKKLEYRLIMFSGIRESPRFNMMGGLEEVGAQNSPRFSGYLQYNFFDPEFGYVFNGTYYGRKRVLGVSTGFDFQKGSNRDPYFAVSGSAFMAMPLGDPNPKEGTDEVGALLQYIHYDGQETAVSVSATGTVTPLIPEQNDVLVEAAYYNAQTKLSVFGKFEALLFADDARQVANRLWIGGGVKYHLFFNLTNFTIAYNRLQLPNAPAGAQSGANEFTLALQYLYF